jgi:hypothetical protein
MRALAGVAILLAAIATVAALTLGSPTKPVGPLRATEIAGVVRAFATAYGERDTRALTPLLALEVTEVSPGGVERGRPAVLRDFERQFADSSISGYAVADVQTRPGWVGRASAQYAVLRAGLPDVSGEITFGVERVAGRPAIGLIAIQPRG